MSEKNFYRFYAFDGESESVTIAVVSASNETEAFYRGIGTISTKEADIILARLDVGGDEDSDPSFFTVDVLETPEQLHEALDDMRFYLTIKN